MGKTLRRFEKGMNRLGVAGGIVIFLYMVVTEDPFQTVVEAVIGVVIVVTGFWLLCRAVVWVTRGFLDSDEPPTTPPPSAG